MYVISATDMSATLLETRGDLPCSRVGHASALVGSVMIVFGGDTKDEDETKRDDSLYLLNLGG